MLLIEVWIREGPTKPFDNMRLQLLSVKVGGSRANAHISDRVEIPTHFKSARQRVARTLPLTSEIMRYTRVSAEKRIPWV